MKTKSITPMVQMAQETPTKLWLDSIATDELEYALANGAVGATCNPLIILNVLKKELPQWEGRILSLIESMPEADEDTIGWELVKLVSRERAKVFLPVFEKYRGRNGRLSIQTDPRFYRNPDRIVKQAVEFAEMAPNIIVKIPVTRAGVAAIEEATYRGISINATVSFTLRQVIEVAEAVERGLKRREQEGKDISSMGPVCTIMVGRLDDHLKEVAAEEGIAINPAALEWAGVAVFKKAYRIYQERGYRIRLLSAAFRSHLHWSELIGGDVVISPPYKWMKVFNDSDVEIVPRIENPVDESLLRELERKIPEFVRSYNEDGMTVDDFDSFGPTVKTLNQFSGGCNTLSQLIRTFMLR